MVESEGYTNAAELIEAKALLDRLNARTDPDKAIERYYRSRAAGGKTLLKEAAQAAGYTEGYLRKRKVIYDREGKWGSKGKKS